MRMRLSNVVRVALLPAAAVITAEENNNGIKNALICRPSELPIYSPDVPTPLCIEEKPTWFGNYLQAKVERLREIVDKVVTEVGAYGSVAEEYAKQGVDQVDCVLTYLRKENSTAPKVGAIMIGGLAGYIFSLRKRYFKRTLYTTSGALIMTAICYPKQTSEYTHICLQEGKKYATIAYNFAYGVKKDDPPMELPSFPQLPSSVSEAWQSVYKTASSLVLDKADSANACAPPPTDYGDEESDEEVRNK